MRPSTLLCLLPFAAAVPASKRSELARLIVPRDPSAVHPGRYLVALKDGAQDSCSLKSAMELCPDNSTTQVYESLFKGFTAELDEDSLDKLRAHPAVAFVEQDQRLPASTLEPLKPANTSDTPHLSRRQHAYFDRYLNNPNAGKGVCGYIIDTGIDASHPDFGGRAQIIASTVDRTGTDYIGHGTHVAGIFGSNTYGIAKKADIFAVKALSERYHLTPASYIVAGMDFVAQDAPRRRCPNGVVVNLSLSGSRSEMWNMAARKLVERGYFVAVAAGNERRDARDVSPASEPSVCTVGGQAYGQSNYGPVVDIWAPAVGIPSLTPGRRWGYMTGTSMAAPYIAGLAAAMASTDGMRAGPYLCGMIVQMARWRG
ncbi:Peptidase S8, subtilisin-related protein [Metarhizium album ARSEF 1941]|uniref:Peptidase S8, subtilisin-related protein n=1 Tax=Metarhizium album (strain ARSEF 1941) TaxID=1081103 RepID=A0A0B2WK28_METAS|nr:Peptidase S8, subtilisin-related protein [Metarhizium album ARSEF 1941]KHN94054.1 Peptidase S8, subtilisin-related protein [Metarhizium album ARSEF 1941]